MAEVKPYYFDTNDYENDNYEGEYPQYCTFSWTLSKQDKVNNYSVITWSLKAAGGYSGYYNTIHKVYIKIDKEEFVSEEEIEVYKGTEVISGTTKIYHNNDGTKSFSVEAKCTFFYEYEDAGYNSTGSETWELPKIERAAVISAITNTTNIGGVCNIKWTPLEGRKYKLRFILGNWDVTTGFINPTSSPYIYSYTLEGNQMVNGVTLYDELCEQSSGTMIVKLGTYTSNGTLIKPVNQKTFTLKVPSNIVPTISGNPLKVESLDGDFLVQNYNGLKFTVDFDCLAAGEGSMLDGCTISGPGIATKQWLQPDINEEFTCQSISQTGTLNYTLEVFDARGRSTMIENPVSIECYERKSPRFTAFNVFRCDRDGNPDQNGKYIKCASSYEYSSVNNTNKIKIDIKYKKQSEISLYTEQNILSDSTDTSCDHIICDNEGKKIEFDEDSTYVLYAVISDSYDGSAQSKEVSVFGQFRTINIRKSGTGIALGKMAEKDELFESKWPIKAEGFLVPQILRGSITITPSGSNEPTAGKITFNPEFSGTPAVVATPHTSVPGTGVIGVGVGDISARGATIYLTRADTTSTSISWIAMY